MFIVTQRIASYNYISAVCNVKKDDVIWISCEEVEEGGKEYDVLINTDERDYLIARLEDKDEIRDLIKTLAKAFAEDVSYFCVEDWMAGI